jgi:hypothetical protein
VSQASTASMAGSSQAGGLGDQGDEARSVRYRFDCRRSCSQGQRPFRVVFCHSAHVKEEMPTALRDPSPDG